MKYFRTSGHYDGQNGEKHDILCGPLGGRFDEFWCQQTSDSLPQQTADVESHQGGKLNRYIQHVLSTFCK